METRPARSKIARITDDDRNGFVSKPWKRAVAPRWCDYRRISSYSFPIRKKDFCRCPCSEIIVWLSETPNVDIKFTGISCTSVSSGNCNRTERILYSSKKKSTTPTSVHRLWCYLSYTFSSGQTGRNRRRLAVAGESGVGGGAGTLDESRKVKTESRVP